MESFRIGSTRISLVFVTMSLATLTPVFAQPMITNQPQNQTTLAGTTATFTVGATGVEPLSYQWRSYANLTTFTNIPFGTEATLLLTNVQPTTRRFGVVVTDAGGLSATSTLARLTVVVPLSIVSFSSNQKAVENESAAFGVFAIGTIPLSYQWRFNGDNIANATRSNLVMSSVQLRDAGNYSVVVTNLDGAITSQVATLTVLSPTTFTRVTSGPGATDLPGPGGSGCVWADFNNDGFLDLLVAKRDGTNRLYMNRGNGSFTRVLQGDPVIDSDFHIGVSAADYDNDGYIDLIIAAGGGAASPGRRSLLYHNNGDGTFARVNAGGITNKLGYFEACEWADYDNDGFLDLFITDIGENNNDGRNLLWHNNGDGTFANITSGRVVSDVGSGEGVLWSDYDNDRFMDLLVLNAYSTANFLYHNDGNGAFTRILTNEIATDRWPDGTYGGQWGDYDNDGLQDLFVADLAGVRNRLYHNNGNGSFSNVDVGPMLIPPAGTQPHVASWGDYDNDGYLDLFLSHADHNTLYRNNGDGTFSEIKSIAMAKDVPASAGDFFNTISWVDYDNDGFLDVFVTAGPSSSGSTPNLLYHNNGNTNAWLEIKCVGTAANRSGIGAKVRVHATIEGKTFWQLREIKSGAGWDCAIPLVAHFGLGDATNVDTLRIEWPSGTVQEIHNVAARQILTITEPPRLVARTVNGEPQFFIKGRRGSDYQVDTSTNLPTWSSLGTVTITSPDGTERIMDTNLSGADRRFYRALSR